MKVLDRIDAAVFGAVDASFLWIWKEFGITWQKVITGMAAVMTVLLAARVSDWGKHYGPGFFAVMLTWLVLGSIYCAAIHRLPSDVHTAQSLAVRCTPGARFFRYAQAAFLLIDVLTADWREVFIGVTTLVWLVVNYAAIPTAPRKPKKRAKAALAFGFGRLSPLHNRLSTEPAA